MSVRSAQSVTNQFTTRNASSGVGVNADSLPTGVLYLNGAVNAATVTITNISTGLYKFAVTMPTLAIGDEVQMIIAATVATISDSAVVWGDVCDLALDSTGRTQIQVGTSGGQINTSGGKVPATLASTDVSGNVPTDLQTIKTQTVAAAAGVTFPTSIASPTNITAGTITTVTNLTNAATAGDFTAAMKASLNAATPTLGMNAPAGWINKASINADNADSNGWQNVNVVDVAGTAATILTGAGLQAAIFTGLVSSSAYSVNGSSGQAIKWLFDAFASDGVFSAAALANAGGGGGGGSGPYIVTQLVTDGTNPLQGVRVALTANNATLTAVTNSVGVATFGLSNYAYARAAALLGYEFTPDTTAVITASGELPTLVMTAVVFPTFNVPGQVRAYFPTYTGQGYWPLASLVTFTLVTPPAGSVYGGYDKIVDCKVNPVTGQPINPNNPADVADGCVLLANTGYTVSFDEGVTSTQFTTGASGNYIVPLQVLGGI